MNALIRKEIGLVFPAWIVAMILPAAAVCLAPGAFLPGLIVLLFGAGAILLSLRPFGQECNLGMFSSILVQPVSRRRVWRVKAVVLAIALVLVLGVSLASYSVRIHFVPPDDSSASGQDLALICGLIALTAYAGGLWTTLLFRQIAAAFWFTLLLPLAIALLTSSIFARPSLWFMPAIVLGLYAVAGIFWGRHQFLRAQEVPWTGGTIALSLFRSQGEATAPPVKRQPLRALFWKEVQSHQSSFLIAGILLFLHVAILLLRAVLRSSKVGMAAEIILEFWWGLWLALPLLIAGSSVAEERRLGTDEAQLCLPVRRRSQAAIKLAVALLLGVFFGAVVPTLIEGADSLLGSGSSLGGLANSKQDFWPFFIMLCAMSAWITLIAFHASSLARTTLQAMGIAVGSGLVLTLMVGWAWADGPSLRPIGVQNLPLIAWGGGPILLAVLLGLAYHNFQRLRPSWTAWTLNGSAIVLGLFLAGVATAAAYSRVWERWTSVAASSGRAFLSGSVQPQIVARPEMSILLPDGRLWVAAQYDVVSGYRYYESINEESSVLKNFPMRVPSGGRFVPGSNWVNLAASFTGTIGLRQNGTLWKIPPGKNIEQIGADSDWKAIAAGAGFYLAVRNNGTLWGWGNNSSGQLGAGPKTMTDIPVRIGMADDWSNVFASASTCTGVKRNGTVWKWGSLAFGPEGSWKSRFPEESVEWPLHGSDWLQVESNGLLDLILRQDGTLWVSGALPRNLLGHPLPHTFRAEPLQVGTSSRWAQVVLAYPFVAAIQGGKIQLQTDLNTSSVPWRSAVWAPGGSNWIAVTPYGSGGCLALAADGTLSLFGYPAGPPAGFSGLLAPSRKPLWTVKVLELPPG